MLVQIPNEEDAQKILEVFPNAIVIVDEELYESIPEDDRKNADEIIESGARDEGDGYLEEERHCNSRINVTTSLRSEHNGTGGNGS